MTMHLSFSLIVTLLLSAFTVADSSNVADSSKEIHIKPPGKTLNTLCLLLLEGRPAVYVFDHTYNEWTWIKSPVADSARHYTLKLKKDGRCLTYDESKLTTFMSECNSNNQRQHWEFYSDPSIHEYEDGDFKLIPRLAPKGLERDLCLVRNNIYKMYTTRLEKCDRRNKFQYFTEV